MHVPGANRMAEILTTHKDQMNEETILKNNPSPAPPFKGGE